MTGGAPRIASISPGAPYLPTLVDALLTGKLIDGFAPDDDPLALSSVTIWVPTRRAARALATEFVARFAGEVALLPSIRTLGDVDDDALFFEEGLDVNKDSLDAVIDPLERHLILSRLVHVWAQSLKPEQKDLYQGAEIIMPSSFADALWFAADLARLMDTVATEEADWSLLQNVVPDDYAEWWQLTVQFLEIATAQWPDILKERGMQDAASVRANTLRRQANAYRRSGSPGPVIAAGSTGSIPATADLLSSIAMMDNGLVVLPGLDRDLDAETWQKIDLPDNERDDSGTAPGHPQYGLKKLLGLLGAGREHTDIPHLAGIDEDSTGPMRVREKLLSEALRPSDSTGAWQILTDQINDNAKTEALAGISMVEADGERQEALTIALALRETLEIESKTAALVTPDRNLARRVAVEMQRFGVFVDDSAGQPLKNRPVGTLTRLVLQQAFAPADPVALISLLKHPLCRFGEKPERTRRASRLFELTVLRGAIVPPKVGEFHALMSEKRNAVKLEKGRIHRSLKRISEQDWDDVAWLSEALDTVFKSNITNTAAPQSLNTLTSTTVALLERCAFDQESGLSALYGTEDGRVLADFLSQLIQNSSGVEVIASEWPEVFDALISQKVTRPLGGTHPRVSILGPLEARLQTFDRVVLGGLNEKSWPAIARNDPFLSRPMKSALGLPPPERRTGLAAHDFQVLLGIKDVVLTRSIKADNAPTVASRWVQRLMMVAGENSCATMKMRGQRFVDWANQIDAVQSPPKPVAQPKPVPPVAERPNKLSITEIETWIADPYAIYAKHILKLQPLEPLLREADARERGVLYHKIMEEFVQTVRDPHCDDALKQMLALAQHQFHSSEVPPEHAAVWWPRFQTIAAAFIDWHRTHHQDVKNIHVELYGSTDEGLGGFTLSGQIDRLDEMKDGGLQIYDYKTGKYPLIGKVASLNAPQLPLGAAMVSRGAFEFASDHTVNRLAYVRLRPEDELEVNAIDGEKAENLSNDAWQALCALIEAYRDSKKAYWSKARPISDKDYESDYDHLARVREWSSGEDRGGEQ